MRFRLTGLKRISTYEVEPPYVPGKACVYRGRDPA